MLGLKVAAPERLEIEFVGCLLKLLDGIGICHVGKRAFHNVYQSVLDTGLDELGEEVHVLLAVVQNILEHILQKVLGNLHVAFQCAEAHLGLDHPELGKMSLGVGVLGSERRSECVDVLQGCCVCFALELAADGEACALSEEVLGIIDLAVLCFGHVIKIQCGDLEHLAGALGIACGNQRSVHIEESVFLEEAVNGICHGASDTLYSSNCVGSGPEVSDFPEVLQCVSLLLKRIVIRTFAHKLDVGCRKLDLLVSAD